MMNISRILLACLLNILSVPVGSIFSERVYLRDNVVELDNSNAVVSAYSGSKIRIEPSHQYF